ncbi:sigma-70 family RNA polymerase sigma factor [Streptomyces hygroscopicus]|uniref:sigma-70 family RNA polymerase sigma factor n=1 Tax=Streptomyces hygroscopicus TaxID=1912 RepID=UPI001FCCB989|nr:sigma-70 family RNA polymerase sigma factor [Streptomyces hygroscopicus]
MREIDDALVTQWALAARTGDEEAVELFVRGTRRHVLRYVTHLSRDAQAADDLVQDTYLRALRSLPGFEGRSSARSWLLTIARRTVADRIRAHRTRPRVAGLTDWETAAEQTRYGTGPGFDEEVALTDLLSALPPARREAFVLTQLTGLPYTEAAAVVGCPVGTVRSRVARARETLIALLDAAEGDPSRRAEGNPSRRDTATQELVPRPVVSGSVA